MSDMVSSFHILLLEQDKKKYYEGKVLPYHNNIILMELTGADMAGFCYELHFLFVDSVVILLPFTLYYISHKTIYNLFLSLR